MIVHNQVLKVVDDVAINPSTNIYQTPADTIFSPATHLHVAACIFYNILSSLSIYSLFISTRHMLPQLTKTLLYKGYCFSNIAPPNIKPNIFDK